MSGFVRAYLEAIGAEAKPLPTGALAVRWPPTHASSFGPAKKLAFHRSVAEIEDAELCVLGSDVLDRILADASRRGFHCIARVDVANEPPTEEVLAANLTFPNAHSQILARDHGVVPYVLFNFRVTVLTDEKRELLRSVLLNAETLNEHAVAETFLQESLTLPEEPIVAGADLEAAYRAACRALEKSIEPRVEEVRAKARALLAEELARIESFYEASIRELYEGRAAAPLEAEQVFRAERDRRVEEAKRKHALTAQVRLVNARTILIPTTTVRAQVANPRSSRQLDLEYDAVNLETNRPICESCGTATATVYLCSRGHLACDVCDRHCAFCDHVVCTRCEPEMFAKCEACVKVACPHHTFVDEIGRKPYCGDHIHACAICGRMVGPPYVKACDLCRQASCAVCVESGGRCTTCRTLAAIPATHPDVVRVTAAKGEPRNLTRWFRGQNGRYTILVGKGAVFQYLYVLDKDESVIRRQKGIGFLS